jgi:acetylornithine deacetylase/succinyl-diaminopimelate desuccinylase-like protein
MMRAMPMLGLTSLLLAAVAAGPPPASVRAAVRAYRESHEHAILLEFRDLLALPNLASDADGIRRNAQAIAAALERRGVRTRLLESPGSPPVVYGEKAVPGARRTVTVYAHYDGQPVDASAWTGAPWTPILRAGRLEDGAREVPWDALPSPVPAEWRLYARSAGDDKAPIIGFLAALDALDQARVPLSVNLKFFFEGEEEAGSPHLPALMAAHRERLATDAWILCDGPVHQTRRMQVFFGARGTTDLEITLYGPLRPLHSGHYGNWAPNPAVALAHLLTRLRDPDGRILVPGLEDSVRPLTESERAALAAVPDVDSALREAFALPATEADGARLVERIMKPALNVRGLKAGGVGNAAANAIPSEAQASIDFRLVPDQTPALVREKVEGHLRALGYTVVHDAPDPSARRASAKLVRLEWGPGYPAARTSLDLPASRAVVRAIEETLGAPVVRMPTLGGSVPMYLFAEVTGAPVIGVPIANHDNNQHAANENLRLQNLWDGIEVYAGLLARLGHSWE